MTHETLISLLFAGLVSGAVVWFLYYHQEKRKGSLYVLISLLRFVALFGLLILFVNPKLTKRELRTEKAKLVVLVDNSLSISDRGANDEVMSVVQKLEENKALSDKFILHKYGFGSDLNSKSDLSFDEAHTNIAKALTDANTVFGNENRAILLVTDGNQTIGNDYEYSGNDKFPIYPVAVGDTSRFQDLRIERINSNRYAFLRNRFPIEILAVYEGEPAVSSNLTVSLESRVVYKEAVSFTKERNSHSIPVLLEATTVGIKNIDVKLSPLVDEKNTENNNKRIVVEVINEKSKIALVSDIAHPDIGTLKKGIESNEQREVNLLRSSDVTDAMDDVDLVVFYQPTPAFKKVYDIAANKGLNTFTIVGPGTDWDFLNAVQSSFMNKSFGQKEAIAASKNEAFDLFDNSDFSVDGLPPLDGILGEITIKGKHDAILNQRIKGVELDVPLLSIISEGSGRDAVLFGENIWKWRMHAFRRDQNFKNFDEFFGKIILNLSLANTKNRFNMEYEPIYPSSGQTRIRATYFDENYVFDNSATILLTISQKENGRTLGVPMSLKGTFYEADLSNLTGGTYSFVASVKGGNNVKSGEFVVQDFNVEKQFSHTDHLKLGRLAHNSMGQLYFSNQVDSLIEHLLEQRQFVPKQISQQNVVSLIDFQWLLALIVTVLGLEWFIRKYNGLN